MLDRLQEGKLLVEIFQTNVSLAFEKTIIMGHSFGGSTAAAVALVDKRVRDCVLLDPWLAALKKTEELVKQVSCNVLLLESGTWDPKEPKDEVRSRNKLFMDAQRNNGKRAVYVIAERSDLC